MNNPTLRLLGLGAMLALVLVVATPIYLLETSVVGSRACFAAFETASPPPVGDCRKRYDTLASLEGMPFIGAHAKRVREEMAARQAIMRYVDTAVGKPDRAAQAEAFQALAAARDQVLSGTGRLLLDELGPPLPLGAPAELAMGIGDGASLDGVAEDYSHHASTRRALEGAMLRDELSRLKLLADRHHGRPDEDLRVMVASLLCVTGDAKRGMPEAVAVEKRRAEDRDANFSRHFGGVRVAIEACAQIGGMQAPDVPTFGYAGEWDHRARMMTLRMRLFLADYRDCDFTDPEGCLAAPIFRDNVDHILELLRFRVTRRYRLEMAAAVAPVIQSAERAERLLTEVVDEPRHEDRMSTDVKGWVDPEVDEPFLPAADWERAAEHLGKLLEEAEMPVPSALGRAVAAMWYRAAMVHALEGELAKADRALERAAPSKRRRALGGILAALVSGDRQEASRRAAAAPPEASAPLLVELAMPDREAAQARLKTNGADLSEHADWLRLAAGMRPDPEPAPVARVSFLGSRDTPQAEEARRLTFNEVLDRWSRWLGDDAPSRRAHRYTLWRHRGDLPTKAAVPWAFLAGRLVDEPAQTEPWLDAAFAIDRAKLTLRHYALIRWRAAAWRGDAEAATLWRDRFRKAAKRSVDPHVGDLLREAGL